MCRGSQLNPHTSEWAREKGMDANAREMKRIWEKTGSGDTTSKTESGSRSAIRIVPGQLRRNLDEAEKALVAAESGIYQRGGFIVRPGTLPITISGERTITAERILRMEEYAVLEELTAAALWQRYDGRSKSWGTTDAPMKIVKVFMARKGRWKLPILTGLISAPTLRHDGSILETPGYDKATGLLFNPHGLTFPPIPSKPSIDDAREALAVLAEPIALFPFVSPPDRSVVLSMLLTAMIRRSITTAPMHAMTAFTAGSGKSMLVDLPSVLTTGREAAVIAPGDTKAETEKRLGSLLLAGESVIAIDNCEEPLGGELLCQLLVQPLVRTRILGCSETPELATNALVTATGNNLRLLSDLGRRTVLGKLDAQCERPELRQFPFNPVELAKAKRGAYVTAALTILRAYHVAGRPKQSDPLGSFEEWSRWVRDALLWLDEADPVDTMEEVRARDPKLQSLKTVVVNWIRNFGIRKIFVRDLIECEDPKLREALLQVGADDDGSISSRRVGNWLEAHQGREVLGHCIVRGNLSSGSLRWFLKGSGTLPDLQVLTSG
jgi:putative DNA primase/helicase